MVGTNGVVVVTNGVVVATSEVVDPAEPGVVGGGIELVVTTTVGDGDVATTSGEDWARAESKEPTDPAKIPSPHTSTRCARCLVRLSRNIRTIRLYLAPGSRPFVSHQMVAHNGSIGTGPMSGVEYMKFGIAFANTGPFTKADKAMEFAQAAEAAGFESIWTVEHVVVPSNYESAYPYHPSGKMPGGEESPIPDPLIWLAYVGAVTSRIKLATGILILPQRNPVVLAKELATLDQMSNGRLELGIGVGWLEEEFDALGVPFADRGRRNDEYVHAMRELWTQDKATFEGKYANFENCIMLPKPANSSVPVHIGGHTEIAAKRAGRLGNGFFPAGGSIESLTHLYTLARNTATENGRDPSAIEMTTGAPGILNADNLDSVKALADIGTDRLVVPAFMFYKNTAESLARFGEEVVQKLS